MAMTAQEKYDFYHGGPKKTKFNSAADGNAGKALKKESKLEGALATDSGNSSLRFPSNIDKFPTYMQYTAYAFKPSGSMSSADTAFGNVGAVEETLITIYLPSLKSSITENQGWSTESANNAAAAGLAGLAQEGNVFEKGWAATKNLASSATGNLAKSAAGAVSRSGQGIGVMEQQALKYDGPEIRTFTCTYTFVPRSMDESNTIHDIIKQFRYHSAPFKNSSDGLSGAMETGAAIGSRSYKFPSLFKIKWLDNDGDDNIWLPTFETCYCKSVAVEYGDENLTTFFDQNGAPTTYTLTLNFEELDYPTKQKIDAGG